MKKIDLKDILYASKDPEGLSTLLPKIERLPGVMTIEQYKDAYPKINAPAPSITPQNLLDNHFDNEKPAFLIAVKRAIIVYTQTGKSVEHFYGSQKKFIEISKDQDDTISKAFTILSRLHKEHRLSTPEGIIANDLKKRTFRAEQARDTRVQSITKVPSDFWEAIDHIAQWSTCFEEFNAVIENNSSILDSSNRNLGRLSRAILALDNPNKLSDEQITIYRAANHNAQIEEGDWITTNPNYAETHLQNNLFSEGDIHEITAYLDEIYDTSSENEQVYVPRGTWKDFDSLESVYETITQNNKPMHYPEIKARTIEEIKQSNEDEMNY